MNVSSIELSRELSEQSGWADTNLRYVDDHTVTSGHYKTVCPAYDLGYLLRKLPRYVKPEWSDNDFGITVFVLNQSEWLARYDFMEDFAYQAAGSSPEDAAAQLAIELFKQGVLTRGGDE